MTQYEEPESSEPEFKAAKRVQSADLLSKLKVSALKCLRSSMLRVADAQTLFAPLSCLKTLPFPCACHRALRVRNNQALWQHLLCFDYLESSTPLCVTFSSHSILLVYDLVTVVWPHLLSYTGSSLGVAGPPSQKVL